MSLIAQCMPEYSQRFVQRIAVVADPELTYLRLRSLDLAEIPAVRHYLRLRSLPKRVNAWWRGKRGPRSESACLSDLAASIPGFNLLAEQRREELVFGAIGQFWQPTRPLERVAPSDFQAFAQPGFGKLALALRVAPRDLGGTWITIEVRGAATDAVAEGQLKRAWLLLSRIAEALCSASLQRLAADLGLVLEDESLRLPGDAMLQEALFQNTHAMTLEVPPQQVWSWLLNAQGARQDATEAELQPSLGARVPGLSEVGDFVVVRAEPARLLVLGSADMLGDRISRPPETFGWSTTWAFVLAPIGDDATRLFVRVRSSWEDKQEFGLLEPLMAAVHDALERRHLDTLCRQAEGWAA